MFSITKTARRLAAPVTLALACGHAAAQDTKTVLLESNLIGGSVWRAGAGPVDGFFEFDVGAVEPGYRVVGGDIAFSFYGLQDRAMPNGVFDHGYYETQPNEYHRIVEQAYWAEQQGVRLETADHALVAGAPWMEWKRFDYEEWDFERKVCVLFLCHYEDYYTDHWTWMRGFGGSFDLSATLGAGELADLAGDRRLDFSFAPQGDLRFDFAMVMLQLEAIPTAVPEPGMALLWSAALLGLCAVRRRAGDEAVVA